jgi:hypothetical protein
MKLEKATLRVVKSDGPPPQYGDPIPVQFNPSTLHLEISNSTEGGESRGRQVRQYTGSSSTSLSLELIFDTADEGTTDNPRSVRERTQVLEQFVYPRGEGEEKQAPPKLHFQWGDLILEGVVENLKLDFDHFAPNGVPLRAKVGFSFKEQDRKYQFLESGPGANISAGVSLAGGFSLSAGLSISAGLSLNAGISLGAVGSVGVGFGARAGVAIGGESAAEFAVRSGLDPAAWRGLSLNGGSPLSLDAGVEIGFTSKATSSSGLGVAAGPNAGTSVSPEGAFGLQQETGVRTVPSAGSNASAQQSFTVAAAGGVTPAVESVKIARTASAEGASRQAFATGGGGAAPLTRPALPDQARTPLARGGYSTSAPAPRPPKADARAASFALGVPLRTVPGAAAELRAQGAHTSIPTTADPTVPQWEALRSRRTLNAAGPRIKKRKCNCSSPCGH